MITRPPGFPLQADQFDGNAGIVQGTETTDLPYSLGALLENFEQWVKIRGVVPTIPDLPTTDIRDGDMVAVRDTGAGIPAMFIYDESATTWYNITNTGLPANHASLHENGGTDQINVAGLSGLLADPQTPLPHAGTHGLGQPDAVTLDKSQVGLGNVTNDAQLKRAAADFGTFGAKAAPLDLTDLLLIEDSAAGFAKTHITIDDLPGSRFGQDYQAAASEGVSSTTSDTFQDKATLTTPTLTGTYRVAYYAEIAVGSGNKLVESRLYNVTDTTELAFSFCRPPDTDYYRGESGFIDLTFTGAAKTFNIQYRSPDNSTTVYIRRARLEFWRVS
jgi:hypothetical protein